jgi:hypothetical protein
LNDGARDYLLKLFFETLKPPLESNAPVADPPPSCEFTSGLPCFITIYTPNGRHLKIKTQKATLTKSIVAAAKKVQRIGGNLLDQTDRLRVRMDIVMQTAPFPALQRRQLNELEVPYYPGISLSHENTHLDLVGADILEHPAFPPSEMFKAAVSQTGLEPDDWEKDSVFMDVLHLDSFVNRRPGSREAVPLTCNLPLQRVPDRETIYRAASQMASYLVRIQHKDGRYPSFHCAITNMLGPPVNLYTQAKISTSLARFQIATEGHPGSNTNIILSCRKSLAYLINKTMMIAGETSFAFVPESGYPSVLNTAAALQAICSYRMMTGEKDLDTLITRLAGFLALVQAEDGSFPDPPIQKDSKKQQEKLLHPTGEAAIALAWTYRELGDIRFLLRTNEALSWLIKNIEEEPTLRYIASIKNGLGERLNAPELNPEMLLERTNTIITQQLLPQETPTAGIAGSIPHHIPPRVENTAQNLNFLIESLSLANMKEDLYATLETHVKQASYRAARYLLQIQNNTESTYYLAHTSTVRGGVRQCPYTNLVHITEIPAALGGLTALLQHNKYSPENVDDTKSKY